MPKKRKTTKFSRKNQRLLKSFLKGTLHHFNRSYDAGGITSGGGGGLMFRISNIPNVTEFSVLFDHYRIWKAELRFVPFNNNAEVANTSILPEMKYYVDTDDYNAPSTLNEILERQDVKSVYLDKIRTITLYPKCANEVFRTGVTTAYSTPIRNPWIDFAATDVEHYGFKWYVPNLTAGDNINVYCKLFFACKGVR